MKHTPRLGSSAGFLSLLPLSLWLVAGLVVLYLHLFLAPAAIAAGAPRDLSRQPAIVVPVSLGDATNALRFVPDTLEFQAGQRYKLVLTNPSATKHYFTAKDFTDGIWTQKVEAGQVEVKGDIHEVELKPGAQAEWLFVPIKPGSYTLRCPIAGHTEAGMTGTLTIVVAQS